MMFIGEGPAGESGATGRTHRSETSRSKEAVTYAVMNSEYANYQVDMVHR
jgi:hypothetical protein